MSTAKLAERGSKPSPDYLSAVPWPGSDGSIGCGKGNRSRSGQSRWRWSPGQGLKVCRTRPPDRNRSRRPSSRRNERIQDIPGRGRLERVRHHLVWHPSLAGEGCLEQPMSDFYCTTPEAAVKISVRAHQSSKYTFAPAKCIVLDSRSTPAASWCCGFLSYDGGHTPASTATGPGSPRSWTRSTRPIGRSSGITRRDTICPCYGLCSPGWIPIRSRKRASPILAEAFRPNCGTSPTVGPRFAPITSIYASGRATRAASSASSGWPPIWAARISKSCPSSPIRS